MSSETKDSKLGGFIDFLKSEDAPVLGALFAIVAQLWHAIDAYYQVSNNLSAVYDWSAFATYGHLFLGTLFAVAISFGILIMTVRGVLKLAYFFLAVEVFVNVIHFTLILMMTGEINWGLLISTAFLCIIIPVVITAYSHEIKRQQSEETDKEIFDKVEELIGFNVTDGSTGIEIDQKTRDDLKKAITEQKTKNNFELQKEIRTILNQKKTGNGLFKDK